MRQILHRVLKRFIVIFIIRFNEEFDSSKIWRILERFNLRLNSSLLWKILSTIYKTSHKDLNIFRTLNTLAIELRIALSIL